MSVRLGTAPTSYCAVPTQVRRRFAYSIFRRLSVSVGPFLEPRAGLVRGCGATGLCGVILLSITSMARSTEEKILCMARPSLLE